jgi:hypothetical protein
VQLAALNPHVTVALRIKENRRQNMNHYERALGGFTLAKMLTRPGLVAIASTSFERKASLVL